MDALDLEEKRKKFRKLKENIRERVPQNGAGWATEQVSFSYWFSTIFMFFVTINCSDYHGFQPVFWHFPFWGTLSLPTLLKRRGLGGPSDFLSTSNVVLSHNSKDFEKKIDKTPCYHF